MGEPRRVIETPTDGVERIAAERRRQIESEGYTPEHDDRHQSDHSLTRAAECYLAWSDACANFVAGEEDITAAELVESIWPWRPEEFKPSADPVRNLVKAGALIAAEIDRLTRAEPQEQLNMSAATDPVGLDVDVLSRVLWVLSRTVVKPADWDPTALVVDRSAAYPPDTFYPTSVALYPAPGTNPGADRWWAPDCDFVNEETDDGGWPLAQCLAILASNTTSLLYIDRMRSAVRPERSMAARSWWDGMVDDVWNDRANVSTTCEKCGEQPLFLCTCERADVGSQDAAETATTDPEVSDG